MKPRYILIPPVPNESAFWYINEYRTNKPGASIPRDFPNAEKEARALLKRLNAR